MNRIQFKDEIKTRLSGYSEEDINKALEFYEEAIDDRMEDGMSEDEAVAALGTPEEVARQIQMDTPLKKLVQNKVKNRREFKAWEIVLLVLGAPLWFPLLIAALSIAFAFAVVILSLLFSFIVTAIALILAGIAVVFTGLIALIMGSGVSSLVSIGAALILAGLGIMLIIPVKAAARGTAKLFGSFINWIKHFFVK